MSGPVPFKDLNMEAFKYISHEKALKCPRSKHPLFHEISGLSTRMVRPDAFHGLFCKGIYSHLLGRCIHYMCYFDESRLPKVQPCERLGTIWTEVSKCYKEMETRLTNLTLKMVCNTNPMLSPPICIAKGLKPSISPLLFWRS